MDKSDVFELTLEEVPIRLNRPTCISIFDNEL
jgi:hypothetical protein